MLHGSWDSIKQTACALADAWHRVVDFKLKTRRSIIGAFDDDSVADPDCSESS